MAEAWGLDDVPRLDGLRCVITGANSGLGLATTKALVAKGAQVTMACRSTTRAEAAIDEHLSGLGPTPEIQELDLEDLASVDAAVGELVGHGPLDLLINNAGLAMPSGRGAAHRQLWANHLGHVALTAGLAPVLEASKGRIVTVSSLTHRMGKLTVEDPLGIEGQAPSIAYGSTKLLGLLFTLEADRRLRAAHQARSIRAAHPGNARSNLLSTGHEGRGGPLRRAAGFVGDHVAQSAEHGALPTLRAGLDPTVAAGAFLGPRGPFGLFGAPVVETPSRQARDEVLARAVFDASLEAVGADWLG